MQGQPIPCQQTFATAGAVPVARPPVEGTPATLTQHDQIEAWVNEGGAGGEDAPRTPLRILLAEDEPVIAMLMTRVLRALGHDVCAVEATGAGAVAAAAQHQPQLMIVDARLRRSSGVAAVEAILQKGFVPHLFMSGAVIDGLPPGAVVLIKPFTEAVLVGAMARAMTMRPAI